MRSVLMSRRQTAGFCCFGIALLGIVGLFTAIYFGMSSSSTKLIGGFVLALSLTGTFLTGMWPLFAFYFLGRIED